MSQEQHCIIESNVPEDMPPMVDMLNSGSCIDCTESWNGIANGALNCTHTGVVPTFSGISGVFWTESTNTGRGERGWRGEGVEGIGGGGEWG